MASRTQQPPDELRVRYTPEDIRAAQHALCRPGWNYLLFSIAVYTVLTALLALSFRMNSAAHYAFVGVCALLDVLQIADYVRKRARFSRRVRAAGARELTYAYTLYPGRAELRMQGAGEAQTLRFTAAQVQSVQRANGLTIFRAQGVALAVHDGELASHPRLAALLKDAPPPVEERARRDTSVLAAFVSLIAPVYAALGAEPVCFFWPLLPLVAVGYALVHRRMGQRRLACLLCGLAGLAACAAALLLRLLG